MNLWIRLLITLIKCLFARKNKMLAASHLHFRVLPFDCDINIHLTNSRYFSFLDLGRIYHIATKNNLFKTIAKQKWTAVITGIDIKYIKAIKPFAKVRLKTRMLTWDEKYLYLEQRFIVNRQLCAIAFTQGAFIKNGRRIAMEQVLEKCGESELKKPDVPPALKHWLAAQQAKNPKI